MKNFGVCNFTKEKGPVIASNTGYFKELGLNAQDEEKACAAEIL